jgi:DNA-binding response OmpR family regulator
VLLLRGLGLPDTTGWDVARQLRAEAGSRNIRVVAITGRSAEEDRTRSLQAGCDAHLLKPVDSSVLAALVDADTVAVR